MYRYALPPLHDWDRTGALTAAPNASTTNPALIERVRWIADTLRETVILTRRLDIRPRDLVLDVGSGSSPNLRANVLCDKYVEDTTDRQGAPLVVDRPMIIADVQRLPFVSNAFDYVICSHVLEHVEHPERALGELERVGRRGYIETPSAAWEKLAGFPFHRWLVSAEGGELHLQSKPNPLWDPDLKEWFAEFLESLGVASDAWFRRRRLGVYTEFEWQDSIPFRVDGDVRQGAVDRILTEAEDPGHEDYFASRRSRIDPALSVYGRWLRRRSARRLREIDQLLRCPDCAGGLQSASAGYRCGVCGRAFRRDGRGVVYLLPSRP